MLGNFPLSPRLNTLLCARNRIQGVDKRVSETVPNLTTVMLASNNVREMVDLEGLMGCRRLTHLVLLENPVTRKEVRIACGLLISFFFVLDARGSTGHLLTLHGHDAAL